MLADLTRLAIAAAALGFFPGNDTNAEALRYVEQARRVVIDSKQEGGQSDAAYHAIAVGYALSRSDEAAWKTIDKIWSTSTTVSALARLSVVFARRGDRTQAEAALGDALGWAASDVKKIAAASWREVAIARVWLDDLDGAGEIARQHLGVFNLVRVIDAQMEHGNPRDALLFIQRILGRPLQKNDIGLLRSLAESAAANGAPDVAVDIARKGAELLKSEKSGSTDDLYSVWIADCYRSAGLPAEALRLLKEAERLAFAERDSGKGSLLIIGGMIAAGHAALGNKDWGIDQAERASHRTLKSELLAGTAVGLGRAGRFEEAYALLAAHNYDFEQAGAVWEIGEIAARVGKPEVAAAGILKVISQPPLRLRSSTKANPADNDVEARVQAGDIVGWSTIFTDCSGYLDRVTMQGQRSLCKSLAQNGKPNEALEFLERLGERQSLKPNDKATAIVSIAEGIIAAGTERAQAKRD